MLQTTASPSFVCVDNSSGSCELQQCEGSKLTADVVVKPKGCHLVNADIGDEATSRSLGTEIGHLPLILFWGGLVLRVLLH